MRNIKSINDLTAEEQQDIFFAVKKEPTAFFQLAEPCVVLTAEGNGCRIDDYQRFFLAIDQEGDVWPVSVEFFVKNYEEMDIQEQPFVLKSFLTSEKK